MKIDFLVGENTYGTAAHFSRSLGSSLQKLGVELRFFWVGEGDFHHTFYDILKDPPNLTCSFSDIHMGGKPLGALWQIPHLSLLIDPPIYFLHQLNTPFSLISCVDEHDQSFIRSLSICDPLFFPHAADPLYLTPVENERPYEVVFFGTCLDYEAGAFLWPKKAQEVLYAACERVLSTDGVSILQALVELQVKEEDLPYYHNEVDRYIRGKDRLKLIGSISNARIDIWGEGPWSKFFPHVNCHPPVEFEKTLEIMKRAQIVLNSSPRFKGGAHERVFYALMCGASPFTGENSYIKRHLPSVQTYQFGKWDVPSFKDWHERAKKGQQDVLQAHTWDHRAQILLDYLFRLKEWH